MYFTMSWAVFAAAVAFLLLSAVHNRRTGYRRPRAQRSAIQDAVYLLNAVRMSLAPMTTAKASAKPAPSPDARAMAEQPSALPESAEVELAQPLLNLNSAVRGSALKQPVMPVRPTPVSVPGAEASAEPEPRVLSANH